MDATVVKVETAIVRAAFERAATEPYRRRLEVCPWSFRRTETDDGYCSPHVQEAYSWFASGFMSGTQHGRMA